jgi:hypothetical protein
MLAAWREGDETEYTRLFMQVGYARHLTGMRSKVIDARMTEWLPVLKRRIKGGSACMILGIEFLTGPRGLLKRIRGKLPKVVRVVR